MDSGEVVQARDRCPLAVMAATTGDLNPGLGTGDGVSNLGSPIPIDAAILAKSASTSDDDGFGGRAVPCHHVMIRETDARASPFQQSARGSPLRSLDGNHGLISQQNAIVRVFEAPASGGRLPYTCDDGLPEC
jgi:hypothetical protein